MSEEWSHTCLGNNKDRDVSDYNRLQQITGGDCNACCINKDDLLDSDC